MEAKRTRGRPRKQVIKTSFATNTVEFVALPVAGEPDDEDISRLAGLYRGLIGRAPHIKDDASGNFEKWLSATAESIEKKDAFRVGYYAYYAMSMRAILAYNEPLSVESVPDGSLTVSERAKLMRKKYQQGEPLLIADLADIGRAVLLSDKKRGSRSSY